MNILLVLVLVLIGLYTYVSVVKQNVINPLVFFFATVLVIQLGLTLLYFGLYGEMEYPWITQVLFLGFYVSFFAGLCLGYLLLNAYSTRVLVSRQSPKRVEYHQPTVIISLCVLMIIAILLIGDVSIRAHVLPFHRSFYTASRVGFGDQYFVAAAAVLLIILIALMALQSRLARRWWVGFGFLLMLAFGSKTNILVPLVVVFYYYYFCKGGTISWFNAAVVGLGCVVGLIVAFWLTTTVSLQHELLFMVGYSDYVRNFLLELTTLHRSFNGALTFQNNVFTLLPRFLWPNKPYLFGSLALSHHFFHFNPQHQQGVPAFGPFGVLFADFGVYGLLLAFAEGCVVGWVVQHCEKFLLRTPNHLGVFITLFSFFGMFLVNPGIDAWSVIIVNVILGYSIHEVLACRQPASALGYVALCREEGRP